MTNEEFGCYVRLLCHAWLEGSIPSEPVRLARILKVRPQTFDRVWPAISPCFFEEDNRLFQKRLEKERSSQRLRSALNATKGKKGGRPLKSTKGKSRGFFSEKPSESLPSPSPFPSPERKTEGEVEAVFLHWQSVLGKQKAKLDEKRRATIAKMLAAGYTVEDLKRAVDGCKASEWHQGKNDRGKVYDSLTLICRDAEHVDAFMEQAQPVAVSGLGLPTRGPWERDN